MNKLEQAEAFRYAASWLSVDATIGSQAAGDRLTAAAARLEREHNLEQARPMNQITGIDAPGNTFGPSAGGVYYQVRDRGSVHENGRSTITLTLDTVKL